MVKERIYSKSIYQLLEMEKAKEKLTKKQKKRLKVFKAKAKVLDALFTGKCIREGCEVVIHKDLDFCSSKCYRAHHGYPDTLEGWKKYREKEKVNEKK